MKGNAARVLAGLTLLGLSGCAGAGQGAVDVVDNGYGTDAPDVPGTLDAFDPGPSGCLGGTPLVQL